MLSELGVVPPRKLLFALGAEGCVGVLRPARVALRTGAVDRAPAVTRVHEATPLVGDTGEVADGARLVITSDVSNGSDKVHAKLVAKSAAGIFGLGGGGGARGANRSSEVTMHCVAWSCIWCP